MRSTVALILLAALLAPACARQSQPAARAPLSDRERDSILARSGLPGAPVVGRALEISDRAAGHAADVAAADSLFR